MCDFFSPPRRIGSMELDGKLSGYSVIKINEITKKMDCGRIAGYWAVMAIVANKGASKESVCDQNPFYMTIVLI